jgi:hypothetical protein
MFWESLLVQAVQKDWNNALDCLPLQMGPIGYPKTSVNSDQHTATFQTNGDLKNLSVESQYLRALYAMSRNQC